MGWLFSMQPVLYKKPSFRALICRTLDTEPAIFFPSIGADGTLVHFASNDVENAASVSSFKIRQRAEV